MEAKGKLDIRADQVPVARVMNASAWFRQLSGFSGGSDSVYATLHSEMSDSSEWKGYRRRRNLLLFAILGYVPIVGIVASITTRISGSTTPAFVVAFIWM